MRYSTAVAVAVAKRQHTPADLLAREAILGRAQETHQALQARKPQEPLELAIQAQGFCQKRPLIILDVRLAVPQDLDNLRGRMV